MRTRRLASRAAPCFALSTWVEPETNVVYRSVSIAGAGSLMATTALTDRRSVSIDGVGTFTAYPDTGGGNRTALIAGLGTLAAVYTLTDPRSVLIAATGSITAAYSYTPPSSRSYTHNGLGSSNTGGSSFTVNNVPIGTAAADRIVVIAFTHNGTTTPRSVASATIGGISAAVYQDSDRGSSSSYVSSGFLVAAVPTGTTATVVVTMSAARSRISLGSYSLYGYSSAVPVDYDFSNVDGSPITSTSTPGGAAIGVHGTRVNATDTWSGTGVVEDYDSTVFAGTNTSLMYSGAHADTPGSSIAFTATASVSPGAPNSIGVATFY